MDVSSAKIEFISPHPQDWEHLAAIAEIDRQAFTEDGISIFNLSQFTRSGSVFCLLKDGVVVGESVLLKNLFDNGAVIFGFAVSSACQGCGIGKIMMQKLIETAQALGIEYLELTMNPENQAAKKLYMNVGRFTKKQELMPHPKKNEPRWLMHLDLI